MNTFHCCTSVPRGTAADHASSPMTMLNVGYSFRSNYGTSCHHDSHGNFHIFGDWGSSTTRNFLHQLFFLRHPHSTPIEFTLITK